MSRLSLKAALALATMIASGADTPEGELRRRLDSMVAELERCQKASPDGYLGGVPGSAELWKAVASGRVEAVNRKWVPWYNLHKMFAGLRDTYLLTGNDKAREILIRLGDWCGKIVAGISDEQMQRMLARQTVNQQSMNSNILMTARAAYAQGSGAGTARPRFEQPTEVGDEPSPPRALSRPEQLRFVNVSP